MSKFYGDVARDNTDAFTTGFYGSKPVIIKFKTQPTDKISLQQKYQIHRESAIKEAGEVFSHHVDNSVTLKHSCNENQVASKFKFSNDEGIYEVSYKPKDINKEGKSLTLKHNSTFDTATKEVSSTETVKFGGNLFGDAKLGLTLDYAWQTGSADQGIKASANVTNNDINFGVKTDYDITGKKIKSLLAQAAYHTPKSDFFLTGNVFQREIKLATISSAAYKANETHACNVVFDGNRKLVGFFGYPFTSSWVGVYRLNDFSTLRIKTILDNQISLGFAWGQVVNKKLELNFSHYLNVSQVLANKAEKGSSPYSFGLALKWRL